MSGSSSDFSIRAQLRTLFAGEPTPESFATQTQPDAATMSSPPPPRKAHTSRSATVRTPSPALAPSSASFGSLPVMSLHGTHGAGMMPVLPLFQSPGGPVRRYSLSLATASVPTVKRAADTEATVYAPVGGTRGRMFNEGGST